jgi:transcriptional regulator with XRE-family HTH domain
LTLQANFDIVSTMIKEENSGLSTYLKSLRNSMGLTLREVEEKSGVSNAFISQLESGKVKQPSPLMLYKLAELYGVPYETRMERAGYPIFQKRTPATRSASAVFHRLGGITAEEERALFDYLAFMRSQSRKEARKK